ncbi:MAG: hemagglutinin [Kofleriaceae bacterium]|nr:hemagglutinin [Kofleriaceae bacterium]
MTPLGGTTAVAAVGGVATFSNLSLELVGSYTLGAASGGLTPATSASFGVTPAAAAALVFTVQPSTTVAGAAIAPAVQVTARDAFGNTATGFTGTVTVSRASGPTTPLTGTTAVAAVGGVATFSNLSLELVGSYTLGASSGGLTPATSATFDVTPAAAAALFFTVQPTTRVAGVGFGAQVTARDAFGNTATGFTGDVTVSRASGPTAPLNGATTVAAVAGVATFAGLSFTEVGTYTLVASAAGLTGATSASFDITPGAAAALFFTVQPATTVAGVGFGAQVTARDAFGNTATSFTGTVTVARASGPTATLNGPTAVAAVAGVATFSGLSLNLVGSYTLGASSGALTPATSATFGITPAAAATLAFTIQPTTSTAGVAFTPAVTVTARDAFGNTATSFTGAVALAIGTNPGGGSLAGAAAETAVAGVAVFAGLSIDRTGAGYTLTAASSGLPTATSDPFDIVPGPADRLFFTVQPSSAVAGSPLTPAVRVSVRDALGNLATGFTGPVTVAISTNPGGSTLSGTATVAAVAGVAQFANLSLDRVGAGYTLIATSGALGSAISATFNISPSVAANLVFSVQPGDVVAGEPHSPTVQVTARDAFGNQATGFVATVTVAIADNPGGSSLGGTTAQAAVAGVASFPGLVLDKVGGGYTLTAAAGGVPTTTSQAFDVTPADAEYLAFTVQPTTTAAGAAVTPAVEVTAFDAFDNVATQFNGSVVVAIGANPGGSILTGDVTTTAVGGVATFSGLSLDRAATGYTLTTAAGALAGGVSAPFEITPADASGLVFAVQPASTTAGVAIAPAVRVEARDPAGNVDVTFDGPVTLTLGANPGGSTLGGTAMVMATAGVATFADLTLDRVGAGYTLVAATPGLSSATSQGFAVTPAAATRLVFLAQPVSSAAGSPLSPAVRLEALDPFGNRDTAFTGAVALAIADNPGASTLGGATSVAATAGVASFTDLTLDRVGTGYTLAATAGGLTGVTSAPFDISPAVASRLAFVVQPSDTAAGQLVTPAVTVEALDVFGNRVPSFAGAVTVALDANPGDSTLSGTLTVTAAAGLATFSDLMLDRAATGYTLVATGTGLTPGTSAAFEVTPGSASNLAFVVQPGDTVAGVAIAPALQVEARDALGNLDPTFTGAVTITIAANPGSATLAGTTTVDAVDGVATFDDLSLDRAASGYRLAASATGFGTGLSSTFAVLPAAPARLAVAQQPSTATAGVAIAPAVQIAAEDSFGNRLPGFDGEVTIALQVNPAGATLSGTTTVTASGGLASFTDLSLDRVAVGYSLRATSAGLTPVDSAAFDVVSGSAASLVFSVEPGDVVAGAAIAPAVEVTVRDALGNTDASFTGNVTLAISNNPGGATLAGTVSVLATAGVASFPDLALDRVGAGYTLAATVSGLGAVTSAGFAVSPGPAATYVQAGLAANTGAGVASSVVFTAHDAFGNVATGYDGTAAVTSSDPALGAPATVAFEDGVAAAVELVFVTVGAQTVTLTDAAATVTATFETNVGAADAPTVELTDPLDGQAVGGIVQISARGTVAAVATIVSIELLVDGVVVGTGTTSPTTATWDATGQALGSSHTITARLTDSLGNQVTDEITVTIAEAPDDGCCSAGGDPTSPLTLAGLVLAAVLLRRRRRGAA